MQPGSLQFCCTCAVSLSSPCVYLQLCPIPCNCKDANMSEQTGSRVNGGCFCFLCRSVWGWHGAAACCQEFAWDKPAPAKLLQSEVGAARSLRTILESLVVFDNCFEVFLHRA